MADVTIVRIPQAIRTPVDPPALPGQPPGIFRISTMVDGVVRVIRDVVTERQRNPSFRAVVIYSGGGIVAGLVPPVNGQDPYFDLFTSLHQMAMQDIVLTVAVAQSANVPRPDGVSVFYRVCNFFC